MGAGGECSAKGSRRVDGEGKEVVSDYEKHRLARILENKAKLEALGLTRLGSSFIGSSGKEQPKARSVTGRKAKGNAGEEDEEYFPSVHDFETDSDDDEEESASYSEEQEICESSSKSWRKGMTRSSVTTTKPRKRNARNCWDDSIVLDDEAALKQAIALSLDTVSGVQFGVSEGLFQTNSKNVGHVFAMGEKSWAKNQECAERKQTRKLDKPRVQLTEDEVVAYFFSFDGNILQEFLHPPESGKEYITLSEVKKMVSSHDFSWKDTEIADMIHFFDRDGDGKLNLGDFRLIMCRCSMIQGA